MKPFSVLKKKLRDPTLKLKLPVAIPIPKVIVGFIVRDNAVRMVESLVGVMNGISTVYDVETGPVPRVFTGV